MICVGKCVLITGGSGFVEGASVECAPPEWLDDFVASKRRIAETYRQAFAELPTTTLMPATPSARNAYWMYTVLLPESIRSRDRGTLEGSPQ